MKASCAASASFASATAAAAHSSSGVPALNATLRGHGLRPIGELFELLDRCTEVLVLTSPSFDFLPPHLPPNVRPRAAANGMPGIPGATLRDLERYAILETLRATGGSTSKAAELLGISVRTIQYRLHEYNEAPRSEINVVRKLVSGEGSASE